MFQHYISVIASPIYSTYVMKEIYYKNFKKNASKVGKFIDGLIEIPMFTSMKNLAKFILNIIAGP